MKTAYDYARDHIRNNTMPTGQEKEGPDSAATYMEVASVIECEVEFMRSRGRCREGCSFAQLINHPKAGVVCRWTMQPCKTIELAEIFELYSILNADAHLTPGVFFNVEGQGIIDERSEFYCAGGEEGGSNQVRCSDSSSAV